MPQISTAWSTSIPVTRPTPIAPIALTTVSNRFGLRPVMICVAHWNSIIAVVTAALSVHSDRADPTTGVQRSICFARLACFSDFLLRFLASSERSPFHGKRPLLGSSSLGWFSSLMSLIIGSSLP